MQMSAPGIQQSFSGVEDLQNMDQSSPSRNAAKGKFELFSMAIFSSIINISIFLTEFSVLKYQVQVL